MKLSEEIRNAYVAGNAQLRERAAKAFLAQVGEAIVVIVTVVMVGAAVAAVYNRALSWIVGAP